MKIVCVVLLFVTRESKTGIQKTVHACIVVHHTHVLFDLVAGSTCSLISLALFSLYSLASFVCISLSTFSVCEPNRAAPRSEKYSSVIYFILFCFFFLGIAHVCTQTNQQQSHWPTHSKCFPQHI